MGTLSSLICIFYVLRLNSVYSVRLIRLLEEIMSEKENKTIIFVETKRRCDELTRRMRRDGYVSLPLCNALYFLKLRLWPYITHCCPLVSISIFILRASTVIMV